jgi:hypothetical protein
MRSISRFRALEPDGLFTLAKDLMRLIADRIDTVALQKLVAPPKGEKWGSLKSLEKVLATLVSADEARAIMGPLAGAYDLRLADAHLPPDELDNAFALVGVDPSTQPIKQGLSLIVAVVDALYKVGCIVRAQVEKPQDADNDPI